MTPVERGRRAPGGRAPGALGLLALVAACALLGWVLWALAGGPETPDWARLRRSLTGSELADADVIATAAAACWLLLAYLALSVGLRLAVLAAARISGGARWARTGLRLSTLVTIPAVRRLVDGGVGSALLAASWLPLPQGSAHVQAPVHIAAAEASAHVAAAVPAEPAAVAPERAAAPSLRYTVAAGDDLWGIARHCYGDGTRFVEIFEANRDRLMAPGERFTDPRRIRTGWVLSLPLPAAFVSVEEGALGYRVRAGDHLWGIAERWLGDGFRWVEVWERNRGREMEAGRHFTDPNLIAPGWRLELPLAEPLAAPHPGTAAPAGVLPWEPVLVPGEAGAALPDDEGPAPVDAAPADAGDGMEWPQVPRAALFSAAGVAVIGGAALFVERLRRSGSLPLRRGGRRGSGTGDAGRVALTAAALRTAFLEAGLDGSHPLLLREGDRGLEVTVGCDYGDAERLAESQDDLARRLGCELDADVRGPTRVIMTLTRSGSFPGLLTAESDTRPALVVPAGATDGDAIYLDIEAVGCVTVTGSPAEQRGLLRSWLAVLSTAWPPDALSFRADAEAAVLLEADAGLPHFVGAGGGSAAADLADELEETAVSRQAHPGHPLVAIFALSGADAELPAAVMRYGPEAGVFVIRCLPPGTPVEGAALTGASINLGAVGGEDDGDGDAAPPGAIELRVGRDPPLLLAPVRVRRDASPRWSESAELAGVLGPPQPATDDQQSQPESAPPNTEQARSPEPPYRAPDDPTVFPRLPERGAEEVGAPGPSRQVPEAPATPRWEAAPDDDGGPGSPRAAAGATPAVSAHGAPSHRSPAAPGESAEANTHGEDAGPLTPPECADDPDPSPAIDEARGSEPAEMAGREQDPAPVPEPAAIAPPDEEESAPSAVPDRVVARGGEALMPDEPAPAARSQTPPAHGLSRQGALLTHDDLAPPGDGASTGAGPVFTVKCLGRFELLLGDTPLTTWPREKSRELLAFLATYGRASVQRDTLAEAMWPGHPADASLGHMLANAVAGLRRMVRSAAGDDALQPVVTASQRYQLQTALFRIDLDTFEVALRRASELTGHAALAEYERAVQLYSGDFLDNEFFAWLDTYRHDYRRRLLDGAARGAAIAERLGEPRRAARLYRVILEHDPIDEAVACAQMRQLAAAGHIHGARKVYRTLTEALRQDLDDPGASPSAETTALLDALIGDEGGVPA